MQEKDDRLESFVNQLKQTAPVGRPVVISSPGGPYNDHHDANEVLAQATGQLRLTDTGGVHFVGRSHWESIIEDIAEVKAYFDLQSSPDYLLDDDSPPLLEGNVLAADIQFGTANVYSKGELLTLLPAMPVDIKMCYQPGLISVINLLT